MECITKGALALATGAYGDGITRKDGSSVRWVDFYAGGEGVVRMTIGNDCDPQHLPVDDGAPVKLDLEFELEVRDGGKKKLRLDRATPATAKAAPIRAAA